jgi:hypothetical protein
MNAKLSSPSLLLTALLCLGLASVQAQEPSVPSYINYQGSVTDSTGLPLGATNATPPLAAPINRKVLFRIYDSATGPTNLLWTEEQTVTISLGQFSVLLGRGIQFGSEDHGSIESVFTSNDGGGPEGPQRFLGITVDNGDNILDDSDVAISPRQQITTAAYSFRAGTADSIASGSSLVLNNSADNGLGYFGTGRTFNGTEINGPVLYGLSGGALGSVTGGTQKTALRWNDNSQVGIGTSTLNNNNTAPETKLVVQGDDSSYPPAQLSIRGATDIFKRLLIGYNTTDNHGMISSFNGSTPSPLYLNRTGGDVYLGNATSGTTAYGGFKTNFAYGSNNGYSFNGDDDTGMYRVGSDYLGFYTGGQQGAAINNRGQFLPFGGVYAPVAYGVTNGYSFNGDPDTGMYRPTTNQLSFHSGGVERMRVDASGNVGIGITGPEAKLNVHGATANIQVSNTSETWAGITFEDSQANQTNDLQQAAILFDSSGNNLGFFNETLATPKMVLTEGGRIGIGTTNPTVPLEVVGTSKIGSTGTSSYANPGATNFGTFSTSSYAFDCSIKASGYIVGKGIGSSSDQRIKNVKSRSDSKEDLHNLLDIEITNYTYKDNVVNGPKTSKKVIAQQVEKVYPQAVLQMTNVIPDIFKNAAVKDGWVELVTDLKVGERVRLIDEASPQAIAQSTHEVLEVKDGKFRTAMQTQNKEVFVYGREVKDFRVVDYDAISMLNVSATQELASQLEARDAEIKKLQEEIASLRASFAAQERQISTQNARDNSLEAKLAAIEKTLSALKPGKRTASLSKSRAAE